AQVLRGMYYAAQNLGNVGAALGPVLCGWVLATQPAYSMFYMLVVFVVAGGLMYFLGGLTASKRGSLTPPSDG
ncbi:MFS transporter, partial [Pseudomonas edaphica]